MIPEGRKGFVNPPPVAGDVPGQGPDPVPGDEDAQRAPRRCTHHNVKIRYGVGGFHVGSDGADRGFDVGFGASCFCL